MAVKITNSNPTNGAMNVPVVHCTLYPVCVTCNGTVDENATTVSATLQTGSGPPIGGVPASMVVNIGGMWSFTFPAATSTTYSLTVTGVNSDGTGTSTITFTTAPVIHRMRAEADGNGAVAAKKAREPAFKAK
jgi:hypothetical protein